MASAEGELLQTENEVKRQEAWLEKAEAETSLAEAQQGYDDTLKQLIADIFDQTKAVCEAKHEEWQTRTGDRSLELKGMEP